ncbi:MAG: Zn-dependent alcohol dehydrogenase [Lentisphaeraceae bacterium]|nr:Zn-dependent alcohol dehydrogenase [Lentisphaeraceae bacterium]
MLTTDAAVTKGDGSFSIEKINVGDPAAGEVLVEIKASGICHTDYDSMSWGKNLILGHEGAGTVLKTGPGVSSVKSGDNVLLNWAIPCGKCFQCSIGNLYICEENSFCTGKGKGHAHADATSCCSKPISRSFHLGTMSRYTVVKEEALVLQTVDIPFSSACIIGCGVMTGVGSALNAAKVKPGSSCAVIGCGGVGLNVIQGCKIAGAEKIIAIDVNAARLQKAAEFGATHFILASKNEVNLNESREKVLQLTENRGADYAFECTAVPELGAAPLNLVRNAGMAIQVSGIEQKISFDCELFEWNKIYLNPLYGNCNPQRDFPKIQKLYEKGELKLDELVSKTYSLNELENAFADMLAGRISKGVILF